MTEDVCFANAELFADESIICNKLNDLARQFFDAVNQTGFKDSSERELVCGPIESLVLDESFDLDQIWVQIQLQNDALHAHAETVITSMPIGANDDGDDDGDQEDHEQDESFGAAVDQQSDDAQDVAFNPFDDEEDNDDSNNDDDDDDEMDIRQEQHESEEEDEEEREREGDSGHLETPMKEEEYEQMDKFLDEMEAMDNAAEEQDHLGFEDDEEAGPDGDDDEEDEIDLYAPADLDIEAPANPKYRYADFFDGDEEAAASAAPVVNADGSTSMKLVDTPFMRQQAAIETMIKKLEEENLAEKDWDMQGEASAVQRPKDALLTKHLDFEFADKVAPPITVERMQDIESMIKRRIVDAAWDDVKRVVAAEAKPVEKEKIQLESEKSELGLADVYEKEYVEKQTGVTEKEEKLSAEHEEIAQLVSSLFYQLDALSNFHFTPNPVQKEIQIRTNVPAIVMEEAIPVSVSTAQAVAPEELYKSEGAPVGETEVEREERQASRRSRKRKFQKKELVNKLVKEGVENLKRLKRRRKDEDALLLNKHNVIKVSGDDRVEYSNSTAVFQKLQNQVDQQQQEAA